MLPSNQLDVASSFVCHSEWASSKSNGIYTTDMPINLLIHIGMMDCDCIGWMLYMHQCTDLICNRCMIRDTTVININM